MNQLNQNNIENYLECESLLNKIFNSIRFCQDKCPMNSSLIKDKTNGTNYCCCTQDYTNTSEGLNPSHPILNELKAERVKKYGIPSSISPCKYHQEYRCLLETHKPPVCIAGACIPMSIHFKRYYNITYNNISMTVNLRRVLQGEMSINEYVYFKKDLEECIKRIELIRVEKI